MCLPKFFWRFLFGCFLKFHFGLEKELRRGANPLTLGQVLFKLKPMLKSEMSGSEENKIQTGKKLMAIQLSIATAFFLTLFKLVIGLVTYSLAVIASAFDSLMDILVSSVNLIAVKEADKPADREHLYGHGKIESLAGLFQSLLISVSGIYLVVEAVRRLIFGSRLEHIPVAIGVMVISMGLTVLLVIRLKRVLRETQSIIVGTEALHFTTDLLTNGGVIIALVLVRLTGSNLCDLLVAFAIAR